MKRFNLSNALARLLEFCKTPLRPLPVAENVFDLVFHRRLLEHRIADVLAHCDHREQTLIHQHRQGRPDPAGYRELCRAYRIAIHARKKFVSLGGALRHSHASNGGGEGALSAAGLLAKARDQGITQLLITQHNALAGSLALIREIRRHRYLVETLPAAELSLIHSRYRTEFHWKVKFPDPALVVNGVNGQSVVGAIDRETLVYARLVHDTISAFRDESDLDRWIKDRWPLFLKKAADWNLIGPETQVDEIRSRLSEIIRKRNSYIRRHPGRVPQRWLNAVNPVGTWTTKSGINHTQMRLAVLYALTAFDVDLLEHAFRKALGDPSATLTTIDGIMPTLLQLGCQVELCHPMLTSLSNRELADMLITTGAARDSTGKAVPAVRAVELYYPTYGPEQVRRGRRLLARLNEHYARTNGLATAPKSQRRAFVFGTGSNTDYHSDRQYSPVLRMKPEDRQSLFVDAERMARFLVDRILARKSPAHRKLEALGKVFALYPFYSGRFEVMTGLFKTPGP